MHIDFITLTTGNRTRSQRDDVTDQTLETLLPWLDDALRIGRPVEIPNAGGCQAECSSIDGALVVTLYGPQPQVGKNIPLGTIGVARSDEHARPLWELLSSSAGKMLRAKKMPEEMPWCAVLPYPSLLMVKGVSRWLYDFEQCIAWAWVTRNPAIQPV